MMSITMHHIATRLKDPVEGRVLDLSMASIVNLDCDALCNTIAKADHLETIVLPPQSRLTPLEEQRLLRAILQATTSDHQLREVRHVEHSGPGEAEVKGDNEDERKLPEPSTEATAVDAAVQADLATLRAAIQSRTKRNRQQLFGIHGGGNIGLGLLAQIVTEGPKGWNVVATSNDQLRRAIVNMHRRYALRHPHGEATVVRGVSMVPRSSEHVIKMYCQSALMALCITADVLPQILPDVARGLLERYQTDRSGVTVLVLMNMPNCAEFVQRNLLDELYTLDPDLAQEVLNANLFVPTVIDRIVTPTAREDILAHVHGLLLQRHPKHPLLQRPKMAMTSLPSVSVTASASASATASPVRSSPRSLHRRTSNTMAASQVLLNVDDEKQLSSMLSAAVNVDDAIPIFHAESVYSMYVPEVYRAKALFPLLKSAHNLTQIEAVKAKFINGPHAILAWLGALLGYKTIAECGQNPMLMALMTRLMDEEIAPILRSEYPNVTQIQLQDMQNDFLARCAISTQDLVTRVGRDPLRKLDQGGRIRGTIELAKKQHRLIGFNCDNSILQFGIAAAVLYSVRGYDSANPGCKKIQEIYHKHHKSYEAVLTYRGVAPTGQFCGLDVEQDSEELNSVLNKIQLLESWMDAPFSASRHHDVRMQLFGLMSNSSNRDHSSFTQARIRFLFTVESQRRMEVQVLKERLQALHIDLSVETGHLRYGKHFKPISLSYQLLFVRHGETYGNCGQSTVDGQVDWDAVKADRKDHACRVYQGDVDMPINQLNERGKAQAATVAGKIRDEFMAASPTSWTPTSVLTSPLKRAQDTAAPFVSREGMQRITKVHPMLRELNFGLWENKRICDMNPADPAHLFYKRQHALIKSFSPDSECFAQVLLRAYSLLVELNNTHRGHRVLVFSHSMLGAACCILLGKGQYHETLGCLAFDGSRANGDSYTMPHATPFPLNF